MASELRDKAKDYLVHWFRKLVPNGKFSDVPEIDHDYQLEIESIVDFIFDGVLEEVKERYGLFALDFRREEKSRKAVSD